VDVARIRRVVPEESDSRRSRCAHPTDPVWRVVQSATFADAPAEARRLTRRKQRGHNTKVLNHGQYGYMASRTAILHPEGGQWTLSRALGEALPALEAVEADQGKAFGELVRERRRQRGLPLPIAEKVLPFRAAGCDEPPLPSAELTTDAGDQVSLGNLLHLRVARAEGRVADAWARLAAAEQAGIAPRVLDGLEAAYLAELAGYQAIYT
jgi:hypothetical protein